MNQCLVVKKRNLTLQKILIKILSLAITRLYDCNNETFILFILMDYKSSYLLQIFDRIIYDHYFFSSIYCLLLYNNVDVSIYL